MATTISGKVLAFVMGIGVSGCAAMYGGGPTPPSAVPPDQAAEVARMQKRARAVAEVAGAVEQGATSDLVRGQAHQALTEASDAEVKLGSRPGDKWFARAKASLHKAESYLATAISQGGQLTPKLCADDEIQAALPDRCQKVLDAAAQAQTATANLNDLVARRQAAFDLANRAWKLADDSIQQSGADDSTRPTAPISFACRQTIDECVQDVTQHTDKLAWNVGAARYFSRPLGYGETASVLLGRVKEIEAAEACGRVAMDEAQRIADQSDSIKTAIDTCNHDQNACKAACGKGDGPGCYAWAMRAWGDTQPKRNEAKVSMQKSCDAGIRIACSTAARIDEQIQAVTAQAAAQIDNAWSDAVEAGDDLASKIHIAAVFAQLATTPYKQMQLQRIRTINAAVVSEKLCPAKKAFLSVSSAGEYQRRATQHCKDEAPTGQGLSGTQVTLTTECVQAFATACP